METEKKVMATGKLNKKKFKDIIYTFIKSDTDLVEEILERKRKEMLIRKENEEYLKELKDKL